MKLRIHPRALLIKGKFSKYFLLTTKKGVQHIFVNDSMFSLISFLHNTDNSFFEVLTKISPNKEFKEKTSNVVDCLLSIGVLEISEKKGNLRQVRNFEESSSLDRLFIEVTNKCNLKCKHCYNSRVEIQGDFIPLSEYEQILKEAHEMGVLYVDITGGETFMHSRALELVSLASEYGMVVNLYTNAVFLTLRIIKKLEQERLSSIIVSLDGITSETHDKFRGVKGAYKATIRSLHLIKNSSLPLRINIMMIKDNDGELEDIINFSYNELNAISVAVAPILNSGNGIEMMDKNLSPNRLYEIQSKAYQGNKGAINYSSLTRKRKNKGRCTHCGIFESMIYISPSLEIFLCPTMTKYECESFKLADYGKKNLRECYEMLRTCLQSPISVYFG